MNLLKRKLWVLLLAMAVAACGATAIAPQAATAQEPPPPHDLALSYRHGLTTEKDLIGWIFVLTNQGGQHAHSGQVRISFTPYRGGAVSASVASGPFQKGLDPKFGRFDPATGIWHFRNLRPGQTTELVLSTILHGSTPGVEGEFLLKGRGEIISSLPREESMFLYNNVTREAWRDNGGREAAEGDAVVSMLVGDRFPQVNYTVDFTARFRNEPAYFGSLFASHDMHDVRVKVGLSPGLDLVSAAAPSRTYDFGTSGTGDDVQISSSFDPSTGLWDLGYVPQSDLSLDIDMPVSVRYTGAVPLEEACLTAELIHVVPPDIDMATGVDTQLDNRARACLGDDPMVLIREVEVPLFTFYPCVGETDYPCNDQDTLELVALIKHEDVSQLGIGIDRVDASSGENIVVTDSVAILQPESMVLQVGDT